MFLVVIQEQAIRYSVCSRTADEGYAVALASVAVVVALARVVYAEQSVVPQPCLVLLAFLFVFESHQPLPDTPLWIDPCQRLVLSGC